MHIVDYLTHLGIPAIFRQPGFHLHPIRQSSPAFAIHNIPLEQDDKNKTILLKIRKPGRVDRDSESIFIKPVSDLYRLLTGKGIGFRIVVEGNCIKVNGIYSRTYSENIIKNRKQVPLSGE